MLVMTPGTLETQGKQITGVIFYFAHVSESGTDATQSHPVKGLCAGLYTCNS